MPLPDPVPHDAVTKLASEVADHLRRGRRCVRARLPLASPSRAEAARREARAFLEERRRDMADALDRYT